MNRIFLFSGSLTWNQNLFFIELYEDTGVRSYIINI